MILHSLLNSNVSRRRRLTVLFGFAVLFLFMYSDVAQAQATGGILDSIDSRFKEASGRWGERIREHANHLFWLLVGVDFAWSGVIYALEKNDIGEIAVSVTKKILTIGFFFSLLKFADTWIPAIINSFAQVGRDGATVAVTTPDGIAALGMSLAGAVFHGLSDLGALDQIGMVFPLTVTAIVIFLSFMFVAAQLLVTLIETYIAIGGGIILLGFGGSRWTTDMATKYLQYAVGTGLKLMIIYLIVGLGQEIATNVMIDKNDLLTSALAVLGIGLVYAYLAIQIPQIASSMMSGSPSLTAGGFAGSALTLGAAMAGGAAATQAAGMGAMNAAGGAAAGAAGLGAAVNSGLASAGDMGKTGFSGAAHAAGQVVGQGLGMAASSIGGAISGAASSFGERIDSSVGGQISSAIENTRGGSMSGAPMPDGGSGSSAGTQGGNAGAAASGTGAVPAAASGAATSSGQPAQAGNASAATSGSGSGLGTANGAATPSGQHSPQTAGTSGSPMAANASAPQGQPAQNSAIPPGMGTPVLPQGSAGLGDASTASVSGSTPDSKGDSGSPVQSQGDRGGESKKLHEQIQDLQGYVPADQAGGGGGFNIQLNHTAD